MKGQSQQSDEKKYCRKLAPFSEELIKILNRAGVSYAVEHTIHSLENESIIYIHESDIQEVLKEIARKYFIKDIN